MKTVLLLVQLVALWLGIGVCILLSTQTKCRTGVCRTSHFGIHGGLGKQRKLSISTVFGYKGSLCFAAPLGTPCRLRVFLLSLKMASYLLRWVSSSLAWLYMLTFQCLTSWMLTKQAAFLLCRPWDRSVCLICHILCCQLLGSLAFKEKTLNQIRYPVLFDFFVGIIHLENET